MPPKSLLILCKNRMVGVNLKFWTYPPFCTRLLTKTHWMTGLGMCKIGKIGVPCRTSRKRNVQSLQHMITYFAPRQKFTTGDPINVSHCGLFATSPLTLLIGPAELGVKLFWTCGSKMISTGSQMSNLDMSHLNLAITEYFQFSFGVWNCFAAANLLANGQF